LTRKQDDHQGLSDAEKAFLFPNNGDSKFGQSEAVNDNDFTDAEFEQTMPFDVIDAIKSGNKLLAIKLYRDQFSANLKDFKKAVECMAQSMQR